MQFNDPQAQAVFEDYDHRHERELAEAQDLPTAAYGKRQDDFLLPVGAAVGNFLRRLAIGRTAKTILEMGTSYGYSTLFLADAARQVGARVISIDTVGYKQEYAESMLRRAGLASHVEFQCGDAADLAGAFGERGVDLALIDVWKDRYVDCFEAVYPHMTQGGLIVTDNMISPERARVSARALRAAVKAKPDLQTVLLPIGSGIELTAKWSPDSESM